MRKALRSFRRTARRCAQAGRYFPAARLHLRKHNSHMPVSHNTEKGGSSSKLKQAQAPAAGEGRRMARGATATVRRPDRQGCLPLAERAVCEAQGSPVARLPDDRRAPPQPSTSHQPSRRHALARLGGCQCASCNVRASTCGLPAKTSRHKDGLDKSTYLGIIGMYGGLYYGTRPKDKQVQSSTSCPLFLGQSPPFYAVKRSGTD